MEKNKDLIFQSVFSSNWKKLPTVLQKHYGNRAFSTDIITAEGDMTFSCKSVLKRFFFLFKLVPAKNKTNVFTRVNFVGVKKSRSIWLKRAYYFNDFKKLCFNSRMSQINQNEMVERMRYGIGWHFTINGMIIRLK